MATSAMSATNASQDESLVVTQQPRSVQSSRSGYEERGKPLSRGSNSFDLQKPQPADCPCCCPCCRMSPCECCSFLCCRGKDPRWYYPWDKGLCGVCGLCLAWYAICLVFPCSLCIPKCRNIICMVDEHCWDGTCFGACICGIPFPKPGGRGRVSEGSSPSSSTQDLTRVVGVAEKQREGSKEGTVGGEGVEERRWEMGEDRTIRGAEA